MRAERLPKMRPAELLYKGYGMFQYDLQHIEPGRTDRNEAFFRDELWGDMNECLAQVCKELRSKHQVASRNRPVPDLQTIVTMYNGAGERARIYGIHVLPMREWCLA